MGPIAALIMGVFILMARPLFKKDLIVKDEDNVDIAALDASSLITDPVLLRKSLIIMTGVIIGFLLHGALHLEPATIALIGATLLMLWGKTDPHNALRDVEWTTLFFFFGLFIMVEALIEVGLIDVVADALLRFTDGNLRLTSTLLVWFSAIASGIVDNIPYTATMIPIVESLSQAMAGEPLWWSLALGACLGGNFTLVGAAANVVVVSLAEKSGHPISFMHFFRYGALVTIVSLILATAYIWLRYL
jgi:Na+/H+ antiporter NhaD/arsenite permease-like protein